MSRLLAALASLASVAALSGCVSQAQAVEPVAAPVVSGDEVCAGQVVADGPVEVTAWGEIRDLRDMGLPVCEVAWVFIDAEPDGYRGQAEEVDGVTVIRLARDWARYEVDPDPALSIRGFVRHEFGHALIYRTDLTDADVAALFDEPLVWADEFTDAGHEVAAEVIAAVLADAQDEPRDLFYIATVSDESRAAAEAVIDESR